MIIAAKIATQAIKLVCLTILGPIDGEVKEIADNVTEGYKTLLEKAIAIYDYLIEYGERDGNLTFCGDGDVCKLLKNLRGKCADFSSVFVALARSIGVPAREIFGTRISKDGDITGAYHCHAEFYLPDYGWIPVDPSDVAKLMLNEDLDLDDDKVKKAREYYFGIQSETYVDLSTGRDIILNPPQNGDPLNYFMYPYAEINGESIDFFCCVCLDSYCTCCSGEILFECRDCGYALCEKHQTDEVIKECPNCKSKNIFNQDPEKLI